MFVKLVEDVKAYGGEVLMFSSMHESGQRASRLLSRATSTSEAATAFLAVARPGASLWLGRRELTRLCPPAMQN